MFGYGKMSGCAVAAMSALAEVFPQDSTLSSHQIAESRNLSQPLVGKIMTILSQHGLVKGSRGPGGGYRPARDPATITSATVPAPPVAWHRLQAAMNLESYPVGGQTRVDES